MNRIYSIKRQFAFNKKSMSAPKGYLGKSLNPERLIFELHKIIIKICALVTIRVNMTIIRHDTGPVIPVKN